MEQNENTTVLETPAKIVAIDSEIDGTSEDGGTSPSWFAILTEPSSDFLTRIVEGSCKADLKSKLTNVRPEMIAMIIRGKAVPMKVEVCF